MIPSVATTITPIAALRLTVCATQPTSGGLHTKPVKPTVVTAVIAAVGSSVSAARQPERRPTRRRERQAKHHNPRATTIGSLAVTAIMPLLRWRDSSVSIRRASGTRNDNRGTR